MKYLLTLLVLVLGLEGVDRALLERAMGSMIPPSQPAALHALLHPEKLYVPPPPPPLPSKLPGDSWVGD